MKECYTILLFCLFLFSTSILSGQTSLDSKPKPCTNHPVSKGKYKTLSVGLGIELQVHLEINRKYRTDGNYVAIGKEFRERYCREKQLRITYFGSKKQSQILDPRDPESTPLAIYYFYADTKKEGIEIYKVIDGEVQTRVLNLTP